jgi:hypothetical protein
VKTKSRSLAGSWQSLRFSTTEPVSATAAPFSPPQSHTQCRCSRKFLCRAAPGKDAFALAWRVCRSSRRVGSPPSLQNPFVGAAASSELRVLNLIVRLAPLFCRSFGPAAMPETPRRHSPGPQRWPLGSWRQVLTRILFGSIFRNFTVHRDRDKPVAGTILKLDDMVA